MFRFLSTGGGFLAMAFVLFLSSALPAAEPALDEKTAGQLKALDDVVSEMKNPLSDTWPAERVTRGDRLNQAFVALTGQAVNPLFGVTALGMYNYFRTEEEFRDYLPLHDRPVVWVPFLVVLLLMLFNSTICEAMPFLKVPLNAVGDFVNKVGAAALLPLIVKMFAEAVAEPLAVETARIGSALSSTAFAGELSMAHSAWSAFGWVAGLVVGTAVYLAVWLTFNVVDVFIMLCPFPGIDAALKSFRLAVVGLLAGMYRLSPALALALAFLIVVVSFFIAGWSFRLSVFGFVFSTDLLFFRKIQPAAATVMAFSSTALRNGRNVPMRTLGRIGVNPSGELTFSHRRWLLFGRRTVVLGQPSGFSCGKGLIGPFIVGASNNRTVWLRLPPRYRGGEEKLRSLFGLKETTATPYETPTSIRTVY